MQWQKEDAKWEEFAHRTKNHFPETDHSHNPTNANGSNMKRRIISAGSVLPLILVVSTVIPCEGFLKERPVNPSRESFGHRRYRASDEENNARSSSDPAAAAPLTLMQQAEALRQEALSLEKAIQEERLQKDIKEKAKIDGWINDLFVQCQIDENTQMLNDVDQVFERLKDDRYSQEQVDKIFKRICETGPAQSRSSCSPIMTLLVDAVGKLDCVERKDNPNKRWSGKVERILRKRLFAMDWGFELEEEDDNQNPWNIK